MRPPKVSVIIPAFNAERHIFDSIQSALNQSVSDLEILLVDNGSTDNSLAIAAGIGDPRLHIFNCKKRGAPAARNVGIANAKGDYFQFLDADDLLSSNKIESQLSALEQVGSDSVASCPWVPFERCPKKVEAKPEKVWRIEDPIEWLICSLSGGGMMSAGAWLVHRSVISRAGLWDEKLSLHDDGEFFTRVLLNAQRQVFVPDASVYYRNVPNSLSKRRGLKAIESAFSVCRLRDEHLLTARDDDMSRKAISTQYAQFAYEFSFKNEILANQALARMDALLIKPANVVGGPMFRKLVGLVGFKSALKVRRKLK